MLIQWWSISPSNPMGRIRIAPLLLRHYYRQELHKQQKAHDCLILQNNFGPTLFLHFKAIYKCVLGILNCTIGFKFVLVTIHFTFLVFGHRGGLVHQHPAVVEWRSPRRPERTFGGQNRLDDQRVHLDFGKERVQVILESKETNLHPTRALKYS